MPIVVVHHTSIQREAAVAKVASVLRAHPSTKRVQADALAALTQFASIDKDAIDTIRREGAIGSAISSLKYFYLDGKISNPVVCECASLQIFKLAYAGPIQRNGLEFLAATLVDSRCRMVCIPLSHGL